MATSRNAISTNVSSSPENIQIPCCKWPQCSICAVLGIKIALSKRRLAVPDSLYQNLACIGPLVDVVEVENLRIPAHGLDGGSEKAEEHTS